MAHATAIQIKIVLIDSDPPIWRRVVVPDSVSLASLHLVIQVAMGWTNAHLHEFDVDGTRFTEFDEDIRNGASDSTMVTLKELGFDQPGRTVTYLYDFGDDWRHQITVEAILAETPSEELPACVDGDRACPPEDSGGVFGYEDLVEVLSNPDHPEYREYVAWVGGDFDPEAFDHELVNRTLRELFGQSDREPVN
jgi:hypothetical protein